MEDNTKAADRIKRKESGGGIERNKSQNLRNRLCPKCL